MTAYRLTWSPAVVAAVVFLSSCGGAPPEAKESALVPPRVELVRAKTGEISRTIVLPGYIRADLQTTLYAKVAGYLKSLDVDKGDHVTAGQLLGEVEVPELIADQARYEAEVAVAELDYRRTIAAREKAPDLVIPQTVDNAKGKLDIARANLKRNKTLLEYAKLTAPFSGIITRRWVDPGALIPAATSSAPQSAAVVTLMNFDKVRIEVAVPEREVPHIRNGLAASVAVQEIPGKTYRGEVTRYATALDEATKTMETEVEIANPSHELRPGMFTSVKFTLDHRDRAVILPASAIIADKDGVAVFALRDGKAMKVAVATGISDGASAEITKGIAAGQAVILPGKQALRDGQPVTASEGQ